MALMGLNLCFLERLDIRSRANHFLAYFVQTDLCMSLLHEVVYVARARADIPSAIAAIVSQKYRFVVSITDKSFLRQRPSFQVHRIDTTFGEQLHSSLFHTRSTSSHPSYVKDTSLSHQNIPPADTELQTSSHSYRDTQTTALPVHQLHHATTLEETYNLLHF